jgi:hypothetical protein
LSKSNELTQPVEAVDWRNYMIDFLDAAGLYRGYMTMSMSGPVPTEAIRQLAPPDLALRLLATLAGSETVNANNTMRGAEQAFEFNHEPDSRFLLGRLSDAWAWLEAHGLIGPTTDSTSFAWQRVTREGRELVGTAEALPTLWAGQRLAGDLQPILEEKVRPIFNLGDYETACFAAMKAVEVEVRRASGLENSIIGVDLMRPGIPPRGRSAHRHWCACW